MSTVISGWSALSPYGLTSEDFAAGVRDGRRRDGGVPGFEVREVLGRKGTRSLDRQTALAVATTGQVLTGPDGERLAGVGPEAGLVLGTATASAQSMTDFTRDILTQQKPYHVDPARFPNTVLNCAAARCAIWHRLRGPNATVSAGRASGLLALNYARRLQRSGRADTVLCGAVEESSPTRSWLESAAAPLGEGCAVLLLEPSGHPDRYGRGALAEVLALRFGMYADPSGIAAALAGCVRGAFATADESPGDVWAVSGSGGRGTSGEAEAEAVADVLGDKAPVRLSGTDLIGDTGGASAAFAVVAVLAAAAGRTDAYGRTALVTAVDDDGVVGCALLRLTGAGAAGRTVPS